MSTDISAVLESRGEVKKLVCKLSQRAESIITPISVILSVFCGLIMILIGSETESATPIVFGISSICVGIIIWVQNHQKIKRLKARLAELRQDAVTALEALERNFPTIINEAANGAQGFVSDLAYKLLSKWLKLNHPDGQHSHLREHVLAMRVGLAIIALHHPAIMIVDVGGQLGGQFSFDITFEVMS